MKRILCLALCCAFVLSGCAKDDRAKRASSLTLAKAETAQREMGAASTDAEKVKIASDFFQSEIPILQAVDDYMFGRPPTLPAKP